MINQHFINVANVYLTISFRCRIDVTCYLRVPWNSKRTVSFKFLNAWRSLFVSTGPSFACNKSRIFSLFFPPSEKNMARNDQNVAAGSWRNKWLAVEALLCIIIDQIRSSYSCQSPRLKEKKSQDNWTSSSSQRFFSSFLKFNSRTRRENDDMFKLRIETSSSSYGAFVTRHLCPRTLRRIT